MKKDIVEKLSNIILCRNVATYLATHIKIFTSRRLFVDSFQTNWKALLSTGYLQPVPKTIRKLLLDTSSLQPIPQAIPMALLETYYLLPVP
jgi:hypothetical protein